MHVRFKDLVILTTAPGRVARNVSETPASQWGSVWLVPGQQAGQVKAAFEIVQKDDNAKSMLINIFGGIMRCDVRLNARKGVHASALPCAQVWIAR